MSSMPVNFITREQYDALRASGQPIPHGTAVLLERSGKKVDLVLTRADTTPSTNPRTEDPNVQNAIVLLADLTEYHCCGLATGTLHLSNLIESGEAFLDEHSATLFPIVDARLRQLENWTPAPGGAPMTPQTQQHVHNVLRVLPFLRAKGF